MPIVTSFGEDGPTGPTSEKPTLDEYVQVFQALVHSLEIAENVFARLTKRAFRRMVSPSKLKESKDARGMIPTWVSESSVVLFVSSSMPKDPGPWFSALNGLVDAVANHVTSSVKDHPYVLIDSLNVRIQHVGENLYRFVVKQKWALENNE